MFNLSSLLNLSSLPVSLAVLLLAVVLYVIVALYFKRRRTEQSAVFALVARIMGKF